MKVRVGQARWIDERFRPAESVTDVQETTPSKLQEYLLDSIDDAAIATKPDGTIIYWNRAAERLYGYAAEDVLGKSILGVTVDDAQSDRALEIMDALIKGEVWRGNFEVKRKDGTEFIAEVRNVPVLDGEGTLQAILGLSRDVSAQVEQAAQRDRLIAELEDANRAKDEFLALISHELRTPLTTILGFAELVTKYENELSHEMLHESLLDIRDAARRMHRTVHDLLALGRLEVQGEVSLEPVVLTSVLGAVVKLHTDQNPHRRINLDVRGDIPRVLAKAAYLEHVFENLLSNAEKYSPQSEPIDVVCTHLSGSGRVVVNVMDRGPGVEHDQREQIFEPFYRSPRAESTSGAGLGLTVCHRLMQLQRGEIWMEPRPGGGSCFKISVAVAPQ